MAMGSGEYSKKVRASKPENVGLDALFKPGMASNEVPVK